MPFPFLAVGSILAPLVATWLQGKQNQSLAKQQDAANQQYLQEQLDYNRPVNQVARWQEAGMNPALAYSQGNPGNQSSAQQYPEISKTDFGQLLQIIPLLNQSKLASSQVAAQNASTLLRQAQTAVAQMQAQVLAANPLLNKDIFQSMVTSWTSAAMIKSNEAAVSFERTRALTSQQGGTTSVAQELVFKELAMIEERWKLAQADNKIKAEILESKGFQNEILEVQKRFMTNMEFTPQHFVLFIQMLMQKF